MIEFDLNMIKYRQARGYLNCEEIKDGDINCMIVEIEELESKLEEAEEEKDNAERSAEKNISLLAEVKNLEEIIEDTRQCFLNGEHPTLLMGEQGP